MLSVRHYRILIQQNRRYWSAQNNLGVQYEKLGLQSLKISTWKAAWEEAHESYPLANLMLAYLEAGFFQDARNICDNAPSYSKGGPRFAAAQNRLQRIEDEERERLESLQKEAEQVWRELSKANFEFSERAANWIGNWKEANGESTLAVSNSGEFIEFERTAGTKRLAGLAKTAGAVVLISVMENEKNPKPSLGLLSFAGPFNAGHLIVGRCGKGLRVLHVNGSKLESVREYSRVPEDGPA
jgi:hypothetical protein